MRSLTGLLLVVAAAGTAGCADLTRPDEILIIAEAPPAPKPQPAKAPVVAKDAPQGDASPAPGGPRKAGG